MPPIGIHHTVTSEEPWDGPAAKANLKNDAEEAYYRKAFAWEDPEGDPKTKAAYKFIHHEVSADGTVGAANVKGCQSGIGVLNGAMGGADIPDGDRQGVYNHMAAHLKDAEYEPAELNSANPAAGTPPGARPEASAAGTPPGARTEASAAGTPPRADGGTSPGAEVERRAVDIPLRAAMQGQTPVIEGVAAVYNQVTNIGGWFREMILPGAFTNVLASGQDVIGAPNHNWNAILGRISNGTLRLVDLEDGLHYAIDVNPEDLEAMSFYAKVKRGDIKQSSFAFNVKTETWIMPADAEEGQAQGLPLRTISEISELIDVSPVTFPAYPTTSANVRSKLNEFNQIRSEAGQAPQSEPGNAEGPQVRNVLKRKRLELEEKR
jgi:HK97 family phage prohead protease